MTFVGVSPLVAVGFAVVGFAIGWLSARLTEWLTPPEEAPSIRGRSLLVRDPLVQGTLTLLWAIMPLTDGGDPIHWLEGGLLAVPLVQVGVTDLRTRYVYNVVAILGLALGLALGWHFHHVEWFWSIVGAVGGGLVLFGMYGFGLIYGRLRHLDVGPPMARGDITIAVMVGAVSATYAPQALIWGVLLGGLLAVVRIAWLVCRGPQWARAAHRSKQRTPGRRVRATWVIFLRSLHVYMPYGPGFCLGGLASLFVS